MVGVVIFLVVAGLLAAGGVAVMIYYLLRTGTNLSMIAEAQEGPIKRLKPGLVKVRGEIDAEEGEKLLRSPVWGVRCVYFKLVIEEQRTRQVTTTHGTGSNRWRETRTEKYWHTVLTDEQSVNCVLEDKTGTIFVELEHAQMELDHTGEGQSGLLDDLPREAERRLNKMYDFSSKGWLFNPTYRYTETSLPDGADVLVVGEAKKTRDGLVVRGNKQPLMVTDKSEEELTSRLQWRWVGLLIGIIAVPIVYLIILIIVIVNFMN
jgi:hypothetical protein